MGLKVVQMYVFVVWLATIQGGSGISMSFDPEKPALNGSVTITCHRSISSSDGISWSVETNSITACDGTADICIPSSLGAYTTSTDVSANIFNLSLASLSLADCKTYTCRSTTDATDTVSSDLYVYYYDQTQTVFSEPGTHKSGNLSITTGCILSSSEMTIEWKIVYKNGQELDVTATNTTNGAGCSDTCKSLTSERVTSWFTHTEYNGSESAEITYMAVIRYASFPEVKQKLSTYTIQIATPEPFPWWVILIIVIGGLYLCGIMIGICMYCCKDEPDIKSCVGDKIPCWVRILICILMIIIIVGLGILTVYGICKCCDCFGCCGGHCDDCCGSSNAKNESEPDPMQEKMKMAEDLAPRDQDKNAL